MKGLFSRSTLTGISTVCFTLSTLREC